jgi:hypothetical protein
VGGNNDQGGIDDQSIPYTPAENCEGLVASLFAPLRHRADYRCDGLAVTEKQSAFRTRRSSSAHGVDGRVQINKRLSTLSNFFPFHLDLQDCFLLSWTLSVRHSSLGWVLSTSARQATSIPTFAVPRLPMSVVVVRECFGMPVAEKVRALPSHLRLSLSSPTPYRRTPGCKRP